MFIHAVYKLYRQLNIDIAPWDITRVADFVKGTTVTAQGQAAGKDLTFSTFFQNANFGHIHHPAVLVDRHGSVMTWHLPGILAQARVVS